MSSFVRLPRTPSAEDGDLRANVDARLIARLVLAVLADAAIARADADDAIALHQDVGAGESGEEIDAFALDETRQPLDELVERDDVVAVIGERGRRERKLDLAAARQEIHAVLVHGRRERRALRLEVRNELPQRRGIEHRARQHVRPGLACLLENRDRQRLAAGCLLQL